jgi:hypothetical protein
MNSQTAARGDPSDFSPSRLGASDPSVDSAILLLRLEAQLAQPVKVLGLSRDIYVKIASERSEWEQAFRLVSASYRACGYEPPNASAIRFTRHHALPDTTVFVAKHENQVVFTLTLVPDNTLLGLPMESIYEDEIQELRRSGRRLGEVTSMADAEVGPREFLQIFTAVIRLMAQYHLKQGGDSWVITVNPRHRNLYTKRIGFVPLGTCRSYPTVQGAPAEAYMTDPGLINSNVPKMYQELFGKDLPSAALRAAPMPRHLVQYFGSYATQTVVQTIREIFSYEDMLGTLRRWEAPAT